MSMTCGSSRMSPSCWELSVLQPHAAPHLIPTCSPIFCNQRAFRLSQTDSCRRADTLGVQLQRRCIRGAVFYAHSCRRMASRGDSGEGSSGKERKDKKSEEEISGEEDDEMERLEGALGDELKDNMNQSIDSRVDAKRELKGRSWFWRVWWPSRGSTESKEVADGEGEDELGEEEKYDGVSGEMKTGSGSTGTPETQDNTDDLEDGAGVGFWRRLWKQEGTAVDDSLDPEVELLVQDLESLTFRWKEILDPTPENVLALSLTALLTLALLKILFQLVVVVITIILSALKYTVLAAVLAVSNTGFNRGAFPGMMGPPGLLGKVKM